LAFESQGFKVIYANEIDEYATNTFEANNKVKIDCRDINNVKAKEIPKFEIMLAGFPCQSFSIAGYRQGFDDEQGRGTLFFELERIFKDKKPKILFLENVKNLVGHDDGNTFRVILEKLEHAGYHVKHHIMNSMEYGNIPQNRERIYIVAFKDKRKYQKFEFPKPIKLTTKLSDVIDFNTKLDKKYYYTENNCNFFDKLKEGMTNPGSIYQWRRVYVRENKSCVCPTLTANMGTGGHNVPLVLTKHGIRKLTPLECFKLQGFPDTFAIPKGMSNTRAYKQAGNSVVVPVIERIAEEIKKVL
jgi:DNA (cytosine-5)-methyltransferase 1